MVEGWKSGMSKKDQEIRIWIIEDERDFREMLREMLDGTEGMVCDQTFGSVEAALPAFTDGNHPNVVLVDLQLPGANGIEAIKHLKASFPEVHTVVLTISDDRTTVFNAICAGASGYLVKNDPIEKVVDGIRLVCQGGSPLSGTIASMVLSVFQGARDSGGECELTARETEILRMLSQGISKKEIVDELSIASHTVDFHLRNIYEKLQVHSQAGAVGKALRKGLI
jgi:DNA-binding NarL/FixJ family response regulator